MKFHNRAGEVGSCERCAAIHSQDELAGLNEPLWIRFPEQKPKQFDLRDSSVQQPSWVEDSPVAVYRKP